jgi:hypothetical protein
MKAPIAIVLLTLVSMFPLAGHSQTAEELGLVLSGERMFTKVFDGGKDICVRFGFHMTFENKGREPVILINPTLNFGTGLRSALFLFRKPNRYTTDERTVISTLTFEPKPSESEGLKAMARYFEGEKPPENITVILKSGDTFQFDDEFQVDLATFEDRLDGTAKEFAASRFKDDNSRQWALRYFAKWGIQANQVQLGYEFSLLPYVEKPDLLEEMSLKWRRYGRLLVGPSGTYVIGSTPIKGAF